jgi:hypothetical protein
MLLLHLRSPNLSYSSALIQYIMERVRLAPIVQIQEFVRLFEMQEDYYMTHSEQLETYGDDCYEPALLVVLSL